jgi:hypothetical protein
MDVAITDRSLSADSLVHVFEFCDIQHVVGHAETVAEAVELVSRLGGEVTGAVRVEGAAFVVPVSDVSIAVQDSGRPLPD